MTISINYIDCFALVSVCISIISGTIRGFTKEALTFITWVGSGIVAMQFNTRFTYLLPWIKIELVKQVIVGIIIFLLVIVCGSFINDWLSAKVKASRLKYSDRILGFTVGALRGCLGIFLLVFIGYKTVFKNSEVFLESYVARNFSTIIERYLPELPPNVRAYVDNILQMAGLTLEVNK